MSVKVGVVVGVRLGYRMGWDGMGWGKVCYAMLSDSTVRANQRPSRGGVSVVHM